MSEHLKWIKIESTPVNYIKGKLSNGKSLSQHLLSTFDEVKIKKVFSLVPQNTDYKRILDFDIGGVCKTSDSNDELISYIDSISKREYTIVFENNVKNKSDPYLTNLKVPYFTKGEEIYFFYNNAMHNTDVLRKTLYEADRFPFIAFVSKIKFLTSEELEERILKKIVESSEEIMIGVYDEESYLRIEIEF